MKICIDSSAKYYQNHKERLQKNACENKSLPKEDKKQQYCCEQYKNLPDD